MKTNKTYWCEHCAEFVEPTMHDVTEKSDEFWGSTAANLPVVPAVEASCRIVTPDEASSRGQFDWLNEGNT